MSNSNQKLKLNIDDFLATKEKEFLTSPCYETPDTKPLFAQIYTLPLRRK